MDNESTSLSTDALDNADSAIELFYEIVNGKALDSS